MVPESVMKVVRVAVTCKNLPKEGIKVKVGLLTLGEQDGLKHIISVTHCVHNFTEGDNVLKIEGFLAFDDLNCPQERAEPSPYLIGPKQDTLKILFVIVPMNEKSSSYNEPESLLDTLK